MVTDLVLRTYVALRGALAGRSQDDEGQTLAEYSLIISAVAVAVVITAVIVFRQAIADAWNDAADCLNALSPCN